MQPAALPPSPPHYSTPFSTSPYKEHPSGKLGDHTEASLSKLWLSPKLAAPEPHLPSSQVKRLNMSKDLTGWR